MNKFGQSALYEKLYRWRGLIVLLVLLLLVCGGASIYNMSTRSDQGLVVNQATSPTTVEEVGIKSTSTATLEPTTAPEPTEPPEPTSVSELPTAEPTQPLEPTEPPEPPATSEPTEPPATSEPTEPPEPPATLEPTEPSEPTATPEPVDTPTPAAASQFAAYAVKQGDNLWNIAGEFYDDPFRWPEIYEANKDIIALPQLIYPDQELRIP